MERLDDPKQEFGLPDIGIPAEVLFHPMLTHTEKILFGLIRNLASGERGCYASNKWLAGLLGVGPQTISNSIGNLQEWKLIIIERQREKRNIYLNPSYLQLYSKFCTEKGYKGINKDTLKKVYPSIKKFIYPYKNFYTEYIKDVSRNNSSLVQQKKSISNGHIIPSQFEEFWRIYPRKASKGKALTTWNTLCNKSNKERPKWRDIKRAIYEQKKTERWQNQKYIPHPTTWLNQSRWLDDPAEMVSYSNDDKPEFIIDGGKKWHLNKQDGAYYSKSGELYMNYD
jgi:hypothetical protein